MSQTNRAHLLLWTDSSAAYLDAIQAAGLADRVAVDALPRKEKPSAEQLARTEAPLPVRAAAMEPEPAAGAAAPRANSRHAQLASSTPQIGSSSCGGGVRRHNNQQSMGAL